MRALDGRTTVRGRCAYRAIAFIILTVCSAPALSAASDAGGLAGEVAIHVVQRGDTFTSLGARFGVEPAVLAADNGLNTTAALRIGQVLRVDNRHLIPAAAADGVLIINVPQRMLFYGAGGAVAAIPVAVGQAGWKTPLQPFTVLTTETDPSWEVPASIREEARRQGRTLPAVVPPGPANPLGHYWLGLSIPSVGIHSTNAPSSIYRASTHGCIRVGPHDMEWLFPRVPVGTAGEVIYEPILLAAIDDVIYLEVHRDVYRRLIEAPAEIVRAAARAAGLADRIDWERADAVIAAHEGVARAISLADDD
jgi:L,D-transpeptidase ErfK/SrfK